MKPLINIEDLQNILEYDPDSGLVRWKIKPANRYVKGWYPGSMTNQGYYNISIRSKLYRVHRVVWAIHYGSWPENQIDHIDGVRSNNIISNLRDVEPIHNARNAKKRKDNKAGVVGVSLCKSTKRYHVNIGIQGVNTYVGSYKTLEEAKNARAEQEIKHGYHINHGR